MKNAKKWMALAGVGMALVMLVVVALPAAAAGSDPAPVAHRGGPGLGGPDDDQYLADALGITTDELQAAHQAANEAAIQQAVEEGLITQAQADALLERSGLLGRGFKGFPIPFGTADTIDTETLLAAELGISVDELQAARTAAAAARLAQAVEDGKLTQEQADEMQAMQALKSYLDAQGLQDSVQQLYADAVQQAVAAGVITQAQADAILSGPGGSFHGFGRHGGRGGMERGAFPGMRDFDGQNAPGFFPSGATLGPAL